MYVYVCVCKREKRIKMQEEVHFIDGVMFWRKSEIETKKSRQDREEEKAMTFLREDIWRA